MKFRLLGPLEAISEAGPVVLGGTKQRATLGYLLLHANRVVATSELVQALWDLEDVPASARKILHNAVWGLRTVLAEGAGGPAGANGPAGGPAGTTTGGPGGPAGGGLPELVTKAPGYVLRVDPDDVDLLVYRRRVSEGRAALAASAPETAARQLREGLDLWGGPLLADLAESGIAWPELDAARRDRLDVLEDLFDAELECGRHYSLLGELTMMAEAEPLRERACGQLMLALYRCGRQADALNVYERVRSALVENLGLEPGHELRTLQHAILTHDAALAWVSPAPSRTRATPAGQSEQGGRAGQAEHADRTEPVAPGTPAARAAAPGSPAGPSPSPAAVPALPAVPAVPRQGRAAVTERIPVSALLVGLRLGSLDDVAPGEIDTALHTVEDVISRFGGTVVAAIGSVTLALFGVDGHRDDDPERAVRAALALRERFSTSRQPAFRAAVTTGRALIRLSPEGDGGRPSAVGSLLDDGRAMLARVPDGEVWMGGATRLATGASVAAKSADDCSDDWQVLGLVGAGAGLRTDREHELGVLNGLLDWARHSSVPHLVTVLGAPGVGKTHLLTEFERSIALQPRSTARVLTARAPGRGGLSVPGTILARYCGVLPRDSAEDARGKLAAAVWRLRLAKARRAHLYRLLLPLLVGGSSPAGAPGGDDVLDAWTECLTAAAVLEPVVIVVDDAHWADDAVLDRLESLPDGAGTAPLLTVATARPELLDRRPGWGGGKHRSSTLTLLPPRTGPAAESRPRTGIAV
ncbi:BTAD domain-containing putative transcriptional regulator [Streptomyces omiyaensis]|uniref:BTAD domain-containing putative transcriptional regulator n=1 Tax=Streptomyces omiyaensis TaxID=68247 RepID=UPI0036F538B7